MKEISIKRGQALVLVGPQGCGKSTKARELASKAGAFVEISGEELEDKFNDWLADEPATVIVEMEWPLSERAATTLKSLITSEQATCHRKGLYPCTVRTPNFIFYTGHVDFLTTCDNDRRFHVVELPA